MLSWDDYEESTEEQEEGKDEILGGAKAPKEIPKACSISEPHCDACE